MNTQAREKSVEGKPKGGKKREVRVMLAKRNEGRRKGRVG